MTGRFGAVLTAFATALLLGLCTGIQLYYRVAIVFAGIIAYALLSVLPAFFTLTARLSEKNMQVLRGDTVRLPLTARHKGLVPPERVRVTLSAMHTLRTQSLSVLPFKTTRQSIVLSCPHRGVYEASVSDCTVEDLFGLLRLTKNLRGRAVTISVQPKTRDMECAAPLSADDGGSLVRMTDDTASPADTRAWKDGDALKRVHWKLSARRQELTVRTYEESVRPDTLIVPDLSRAPIMGDRALRVEDAVCETALSLAKAHLLSSFPVRMPLINQNPTEISGTDEKDLPRFISSQTEAAFDGESPYREVLSLLMRRTQRTGAVLLVTAQLDGGVAEAAAQLASFGVSVTVYAVGDVSDTWIAYLMRSGIETVKVAV